MLDKHKQGWETDLLLLVCGHLKDQLLKDARCGINLKFFHDHVLQSTTHSQTQFSQTTVFVCDGPTSFGAPLSS